MVWSRRLGMVRTPAMSAAIVAGGSARPDWSAPRPEHGKVHLVRWGELPKPGFRFQDPDGRENKCRIQFTEARFDSIKRSLRSPSRAKSGMARVQSVQRREITRAENSDHEVVGEES
jgi:hypothetical protein